MTLVLSSLMKFINTVLQPRCAFSVFFWRARFYAFALFKPRYIKYLTQCIRLFFRCSLSALTNYFQFTDFFCDGMCCACSVVMRMFPFFNVARPGQLSSTHFKYFYIFFFVLYRIADVQLSMMFCTAMD